MLQYPCATEAYDLWSDDRACVSVKAEYIELYTNSLNSSEHKIYTCEKFPPLIEKKWRNKNVDSALVGIF